MTTEKAKPDDPAQSKRFVDMARKVEADERPEAFERAFNKVSLHKSAPSPSLPRSPTRANKSAGR